MEFEYNGKLFKLKKLGKGWVEEKTEVIPLGEAWGLGDIKDRLYLEGGHLWKEQKVGIKVFDGTESFGGGIMQDNGALRLFWMTPPYMVSGIGLDGYCTHYTKANWSTTGNYNNVRFGQVNRAIYFWVPFETLNEFKAYLAAQYVEGNPVTVQYQLAEPIIHDLGELTIPTYYPQTVLQLTSSTTTPAGGMTAEYKKIRKD